MLTNSKLAYEPVLNMLHPNQQLEQFGMARMIFNLVGFHKLSLKFG
ncbi:hypothetical protein N644_1557 [Lactiplantibacillus paraplantarum]|uniref:Uncharacterized protein n=1 Tax=Lactiplantibacillus paraplantarum TaxID=60520 RepID=A0ABQ0NDY6_9LACO|nr:hypothetical protein N644_1557 [Lactiplantibacillus paraplantarum]GBF03282.1 hypothetical protein LPPLD21_02837 [Lactiplantibacillus paraplantarum]GEO60688.1 hypothetical protein LPA07_10090 [Lactiplantibacillus paraplantarum]